MTNSASEVLELNITGIGRVHAGLSWDALFSSEGMKNFSGKEVRDLRRRNFPYQKIVSWMVAFCVIMTGSYLSGSYFMTGRVDYAHLPHALLVSALLFLIGIFGFLRSKGADEIFYDDKASDTAASREKDHDHFDIDLHAFVFDKDKNLLFEINPDIDNLISPDSSIYHSAEGTDGQDIYDDETIHVETKKVSDEYRYIAICLSNDCKFEFDKIANLKIRLANTMDNKDFHSVDVNSAENDGYIFGCLQKDGDKWVFRKIEKYIPFDEFWHTEISKHI